MSEQLTIDGKAETIFEPVTTKYHKQASLFQMTARQEQIDPLGTIQLFEKVDDDSDQ